VVFDGDGFILQVHDFFHAHSLGGYSNGFSTARAFGSTSSQWRWSALVAILG
jgi:hypothetical protein